MCLSHTLSLALTLSFHRLLRKSFVCNYIVSNIIINIHTRKAEEKTGRRIIDLSEINLPEKYTRTQTWTLIPFFVRSSWIVSLPKKDVQQFHHITLNILESLYLSIRINCVPENKLSKERMFQQKFSFSKYACSNFKLIAIHCAIFCFEVI